MKAVSQYRRPLSALVAVLLVPASLGLLPGAAAAAPSTRPTAPPAAGADVELTAAAPLLDAPVNGPEALRELGDQVAAAAARNELSTTELRTLLRTDESAWVARDGAVYYVDPVPEAVDAQPASTERVAPLADTFALNSNPGAALTILLDFDGATVTGTQWNASNGVLAGAHPAWDPAGNGPAFSDDELVKIQQVWAIVAEDYAPFDVNVTTQDPGQDAMVRSSSSDGVYGTRVLVSPSDDAYAKICNRQCGGVAFLGVFDRVGTYTQPAWVFPQALGDGAKYVAEAASHEAGHNLDLQHDGTSTLGYYEGHGIWAPVMGVGYGVPLSQWSRGSYVDADNFQDDVAILTRYLGARADDASDAVLAASPLPTGQALIGSRSDVDSYLLGSCPAGSVVEVAPSALAPNLDVKAVLYDATGTERAVSAPASGRGTMFRATGLDAALVVPEAGDGWVVTVEGAGQGEWASLGYDDYGSLGSYTVTAPGCTVEDTTGVPSEPTGLTTGTAGLDSVTLTWSEPAELAGGPVTAYVVTRSGSSESWTLAAGARSHTFTGLTPGTSYDLSVRAVNAAGSGRWATVTATTQDLPPVAPSAPRDLFGLHNQQDGRLEVTWSEPEDSGTQPITGYAVYLNGARLGQLGATARGAYLTRDGGHPDGTYVVGVAAVSAAGQSPTAEVTITVKRPVAPPNDAVAAAQVITGVSGSVVGDNSSATGEPTDPVVSGAGGYSVWYAWTPASTGWVTMSTSGGGAGRSTALSVMQGSPGTWSQLPGFNNTYGTHASGQFEAQAGTRYLVAVDGYDRVGGVGPFTLTWEQVPAVKPGAPRSVQARAGLNSAHVTWDAPDGGPGSDPTSYSVTASPGGQTCLSNPFPNPSGPPFPPATECTVSRLTNGQAYTFTVTASNSAGSTTSAPTAPVTPQMDTTPPRMSEVTVTPDRVSFFGGTVTVTMRVTDEGSGLQGSPNFTFSGGDGGLGSLTRISGDRYDGVYRGTYTFAALSALGTRTLSVYPLRDEAGNSTFFVDGPSVVVGAPGTPAAPTATIRDDRRVELRWVAPDQDGNVIDSYEVELVPTGEVFTTTSPSYVHALGNRPASQPVSYRVRAHNAGGWSRWSPATTSLVVPALVPDIPASPSVVGGDAAVTVTWAEVAGNGDPVTGYVVRAYAGGAVKKVVEVGAGVTSTTVTGLVNGTSHTFTVTAVNGVGASPESAASAAVTPVAPPKPGPKAKAPSQMAPPKVTVRGKNAVLRWKAAKANGTKVTSYLIDVAPNKRVKDRVVKGASRQVTLKKLRPGTYRVRIAARNAAGTSKYSRWVKIRIR